MLRRIQRVVAFCCLLLGGCSSILLRVTPAEKISPGNQSKYVYPGAAWDCEVLRQIVWGHNPDAGMLPPVIFDVIAGLLYRCDLPLSFAADTIGLPYDGYRVTIGGYRRDGRKECTPP